MKPRILIVDDSITVRMDLKEALEEAGFETALCATAAAARDLLERQGFDAVILDVLLPDADGIQFLKELKSSSATAGVPVMLLTSEDEVGARVRGLKTGADEYLGKPYNRAQVISRTHELLRRARPQGREKPLILTIDDSPTFVAELREALTGAGYDVASAPNGEEGLRLAADLRPDALVVDQQMPGLDGYEVLRRVRGDAALRRSPCLFLTASRQPGSELKALDAGADAFVPKDGDLGVLLAKVTALLRPGRSQPGRDRSASLLGPKRILAVDDSPTYLAELAEQLRQEGYDVVCASSGEEAVELLGAQAVDAILLDFIMPGMGGKAACQRLKSHPLWRDLPLLMLTALSEREAMLEGINAGADDYITKSADFDVLKARLKAQLRRRQFEDENRGFREELLRREMEAIEVEAVRELSQARALHIADLESKNAELHRAQQEALGLAKELESFSYSVSHDLRAPLRSINGFSQALLEDCDEALGAQGRSHLDRVCKAVARMERLIDDMLSLAHVSRRSVVLEDVDLSALASQIGEELRARDPRRQGQFHVPAGLRIQADLGMLRILMENLLGNAWKFSSGRPRAEIFLSADAGEGGTTVYSVRDNGAGFDMAYADKLFGAFQRLHSESQFPGTGIGLATVQRVVRRHGGRLWAEGKVGEGAAFHFSW